MGKPRSSRLSHLGTNDDNVARNKNQTLTFGDFPAEIRNQIYQYTLLEEKEMYPYQYQPYNHFEGFTKIDHLDESWAFGGEDDEEVDIKDPVILSHVHQLASLEDEKPWPLRHKPPKSRPVGENSDNERFHIQDLVDEGLEDLQNPTSRKLKSDELDDADPIRWRLHKEPTRFSLLSVNKMINREATEVLYSEAHFKFTAEIQLIRFFTDKFDTSEVPAVNHVSDLMVAADIFPSRHLIRKVQIGFASAQGGPPEVRLERGARLRTNSVFQSQKFEVRQLVLQEIASRIDLTIWTINLAAISLLRDLTHLTIDIKFLFSQHVKLCRMSPALCAILGKLRFRPSLNVEVLGQWCNGENAAVARAIERGSGIAVSYEEPNRFNWDVCEHYPDYTSIAALDPAV